MVRAACGGRPVPWQGDQTACVELSGDRDEREHADRGASFNATLDGFAAGELASDRGPPAYAVQRALEDAAIAASSIGQ
jgi:hypothetical protein